MYFGDDQASEDGAVSCSSSLLYDKMKETNDISHAAAITGTVKKEKKKLFLLFPYILFETLLTDASLFHKDTWNLDVDFLPHAPALILMIISTLWAEAVTIHMTSHKQKERRCENCGGMAAASRLNHHMHSLSAQIH